ncbi:MAG TPA: class IV adenylate cyclase [Bryobacteraceae bacterium]|nr:class IV adenylate cyclase [Bryobacteraceae bacterium]
MIETEIKLRWDGDADSARAHLEAHGYRATGPRLLEADQLFDRASGDVRDFGALRGAGQILRLRISRGKSTVTYKGPAEAAAGPFKSREEIEFDVTDAGAFEEVLARLGYQRAFRYEKYRTKFAEGQGGEGIVTLDETPIGIFMELEGPKYWIDATAKHLGFGRDSYLTASYAALYSELRAKHPEAPAEMVFFRNSVTLP